jgi:hypothetical protein
MKVTGKKRISGKQVIHYRNYRRARDRALTRLSQAYPETYKELLELEKVNDATSGAKWVDIDGNSSFIVGVGPGGGEGEQASDPADNRENEGDSK